MASLSLRLQLVGVLPLHEISEGQSHIMVCRGVASTINIKGTVLCYSS